MKEKIRLYREKKVRREASKIITSVIEKVFENIDGVVYKN